MGRAPGLPARAAGSGGAPRPDEFFELVFEVAPQAIVVAQDGRLAKVNAAAERVAGLPRSEMVGRPISDLVHPEDAPALAERYRRRLEGEQVEERFLFRVGGADPDARWVEATARRIDWQDAPALLVYLDDVSERERERRQAAELSRLLEHIAEVSPYFIFVFDYELGRDVYINRSVPIALGYSLVEAAALEPYPFAELCHPEDFARAMERDARWQTIADGAIDAVEFRMRNRAGEWRWFRSLNTPFLRDAVGRVRQMLGVCVDITALKRSEDALRRSEKLESLGLLAGGLAHDFGNLLTPVLGHAELLLRKLEPGSAQRAHAETIRQAAERASELIHQLLVVSGRGEFEPHPVALDSLIVELAAMLESVLPAEVTLATEIAPALPAVAGDPTQLRQVVLNLVANAGDALAGRGGTIVVRALPIDVDETLSSVLELREQVEPGPAVLLEVEDDGPGMDAATRERLLEPFFTTKPKGKGLGLASVVGIVRRHRGGLAVDSNPGRGTIFRILLPLAAPPVGARVTAV